MRMPPSMMLTSMTLMSMLDGKKGKDRPIRLLLPPIDSLRFNRPPYTSVSFIRPSQGSHNCYLFQPVINASFDYCDQQVIVMKTIRRQWMEEPNDLCICISLEKRPSLQQTGVLHHQAGFAHGIPSSAAEGKPTHERHFFSQMQKPFEWFAWNRIKESITRFFRSAQADRLNFGAGTARLASSMESFDRTASKHNYRCNIGSNPTTVRSWCHGGPRLKQLSCRVAYAVAVVAAAADIGWWLGDSRFADVTWQMHGDGTSASFP